MGLLQWFGYENAEKEPLSLKKGAPDGTKINRISRGHSGSKSLFEKSESKFPKVRNKKKCNVASGARENF